MNERIKELAEQAGFETDRGPLIVPGPYIKVGGLCVGVPLEKFAELIVEECRYVMDCNKGSDQNPVWNQALSETSEKIKQHFGVDGMSTEDKKTLIKELLGVKNETR
jgi:hypothetical protein